jgi:hypothetical protein
MRRWYSYNTCFFPLIIFTHDSFKYVRHPEQSQFGGLSVAIPGEIRGFYEVHSKFGKLPWNSLVGPSIQLAQEGFPVTAVMEQRLDEDRDSIMKSETFRSVYAPNGTLLRRGDVVRRLQYAQTLRQLANDPLAFYEVATINHDRDRLFGNPCTRVPSESPCFELFKRMAGYGPNPICSTIRLPGNSR